MKKALKKDIFRAFARTFVFKRYDQRNSSAEITGFRVYFPDFQLFSYQFREIFLRQDYYFATPKKDPFIIDCGSNIGMSILFFKKLYPDARITGFEPNDAVFTYLERNIRENNLSGVDMHMKAVTDREGPVELFYNPDKPGALTASTLRERNPARHKSVEATMLSNHIDTDVDFLKLDIEGGERDVITELIRENKLGFIKQMIVEYHHHITPEINTLSGLLGLLEDAGFGYQIEGRMARPYKKGQFQDILIYAYQTSEC